MVRRGNIKSGFAYERCRRCFIILYISQNKDGELNLHQFYFSFVFSREVCLKLWEVKKMLHRNEIATTNESLLLN